MDYKDCLSDLARIVGFLQIEGKLNNQIKEHFAILLEAQLDYSYDNLSPRTLLYLLAGFRTMNLHPSCRLKLSARLKASITPMDLDMLRRTFVAAI